MGAIPIGDAAAICKRRSCAYVIVFGVREDGQQFHVTTYGKTKQLCKLAGSIGDQIADAVLQGRVKPPKDEPSDAEMIARAAPDLLAACEAVLASPKMGNEPSEEAIDMVRAAIAKARGSS